MNKKAVLLGVSLFALIWMSYVFYLMYDGRAKPCEGYTLFAPLNSTQTYLINNDGDVVHTWNSRAYPGNSVYLLENGHLLRTVKHRSASKSFVAGGAGGAVEELDWNGNILWEYRYSNSDHRLHHDIKRLPNGNILMIAWEYKTNEEAIKAGRNSQLLNDEAIWPDHIIEVKPVRPKGGQVVWEWHLWDHLIQDYDPAKSNYGNVSHHPELVDINYVGTMSPGSGGADWTHTNAIDYNPELDQILISVHGFNEVWFIDHSTTTAEATGHKGGKCGKGGDLLYRWGNPRTYRMGGTKDQQLFGQHDAKWIEPGRFGEGHILVFNNGLNRNGNGKGYSTVEEIMPPVDLDGNYEYVDGGRYGPEKAIWSYRAKPTNRLYSAYISGAQRLPNGNTLICSGYNGRFFEIAPNGKTVWSYINPYTQLKQNTNKVVLRNGVFRAERYAVDYVGLRRKNM